MANTTMIHIRIDELRLRCALYNDTFDTALNNYIAKGTLLAQIRVMLPVNCQN
ncbi:MAG: hypothetical protein ACP5SH_07090 [Syntrophobacteraceae bacterium]